MAGVGSKVRAVRDPDETEESGGEEPSVAVSNTGKWAEKSLPASSTNEIPNSAKETPDKAQAKSVVEAFGEVRALLWREEWMRAQIELLSQQRDQMARSLEKVMHEKTPVLLAPPPTKKRKLEGLTNGASNHSPREGAQAMLLDSPRDGDESSGNAWGCVRAVDWEQLLAGRRRALIHSVVPPDSLPPLPSAQESRKRWRASAAHYQLHRNRQQAEEEAGGRHEGGPGSGRRGGGGSGAVKHSPHSSHHPLHAGSNRKNHHGKHHHHHHGEAGAAAADSPSANSKNTGSVLKGGRSVVTNSGQKVVIKFSATRPPPQGAARAPASPAHTPLSKYKNGALKDGRGADSGPSTPIMSAQKKHKSLLSLVTQSKTSSPRMSPSANPSTPRGADWGIDDYVYGGPRTHTKIEIVKAKEIATPKWHVVQQNAPPAKEGGKKDGRQSRSLSVGSKYAKAKPHAHTNGQNGANGANGANGEGSSEEDTDDETYISRHRPFEEQETKFRFPKQLEREQKHLEALKKEGGYMSKNDSEQAYKSLWYRGDSSDSLNVDTNGKGSKPTATTPRGSDVDTASPRPVEDKEGSKQSTPKPGEEGAAGSPLLDEVDGKTGKSRKNPPCDRVLVTG